MFHNNIWYILILIIIDNIDNNIIKNDNDYTVNKMKNIKLCFHHPQFIYKFKIDITVLDNINMLSI